STLFMIDSPRTTHYKQGRRPPSSSGLGHSPLTAKTGVRVPLGVIGKPTDTSCRRVFSLEENRPDNRLRFTRTTGSPPSVRTGGSSGRVRLQRSRDGNIQPGHAVAIHPGPSVPADHSPPLSPSPDTS